MNVEEINPGYDQPQKSGRSWFACFGIGCVVLFLLCGAGAAVTYFVAGDYVKMAIEQGQMHAETLSTAMENETVREKLGDNIQPDPFAMPTQTPGEGQAMTTTYAVPLNGSNGSGTLNVEYVIEPGKPVQRTMFNVEIDGEIIDMMDSDGMELDIEVPSEAGSDSEEEGSVSAEEEEPVGAGGY